MKTYIHSVKTHRTGPASLLFSIHTFSRLPLRRRHTNNNTALLQTLHVTLVITPYPIPHRHEVEARFVEYVIAFGRRFQQTVRQSIVESLLFGGVVFGRVSEVSCSIGEEVFFQLLLFGEKELERVM